ncbi:hypothetical protein HOP61_17945 [Halomonas daqingensis]|uniref:Uncharacterized protein n=1 Tax=Billgrantia desiderata TaxID=52021 RepID=A0AAW4YYP6_9GAMM|nr:hypothetical protein [Halomonas desiderata]MCE8053177.1 hypothetical protein [Halomonas desiderata]
MIPSRKSFDLWETLRWAVADPNRGPELARILDQLVLEPGEETSKQARRHLKRLFGEFNEC